MINIAIVLDTKFLLNFMAVYNLLHSKIHTSACLNLTGLWTHYPLLWVTEPVMRRFSPLAAVSPLQIS